MLGLSAHQPHQVLGPTQAIATAAPALEVEASNEEGGEAEGPPSPWHNKCKAKLRIWEELDDPLSAIHFMDVQQIHKKWAP